MDLFLPVVDWLRQTVVRFHEHDLTAKFPKRVDLAIVGANVRRGNSESEAILARGVPRDNVACWMCGDVLDSGGIFWLWAPMAR